MENAYFDSKEFKELLRQYETMREGGASTYLDSEQLTDIAEYYHNCGMLDDAVSAAAYAINIFAGATAPLVFMARKALTHDKDIEQAQAYADQIDDKSDLDYYYIQAEIMLNRGDYEQADRYLHDRYDSLTDELDRSDFILDVATLFADYERMDEAQEWLKQSDETDSNDYQEALGRILLSKGDYAESERIFTRLIDENPFSAFYWNQLSASQLMQNNIQEAITSSEYAIAINPSDEEALLNKANGLLMLYNYPEALKYYRQYTEMHPDESVGELYQGICLFNMSQFEASIAHLQAAERNYRGENAQYALEIYQEMAFSLSRTGRLDEALEYVRKTESLDCNHNEMMVLKGHLYLEHQRIDEAQMCFQQAINDSGSSPDILLRIAISIYDNDYIQLAYKMLRSLLDSAGDEWHDGYSYLAVCAHELGYKEEYLRYLEKAVHENPLEARNVLSGFFPEGMEPEDYLGYAKKGIEN